MKETYQIRTNIPYVFLFKVSASNQIFISNHGVTYCEELKAMY